MSRPVTDGPHELQRVEKDKEAEQHQAFGYADLFGDGSCAELGYISLPEILEAGAELDLHWTPKTLREVKAEGRQ